MTLWQCPLHPLHPLPLYLTGWCHTFFCEKMTTLFSVSKWPHFCPTADTPLFQWVYNHTFPCGQTTTLLLVSRWHHFDLWTVDPTFVCEQATTFLCVSRWPHFCQWVDDKAFLGEQMTIFFCVQIPHICLFGGWPHLFSVLQITTLLLLCRWLHLSLWFALR